MKNRKKQKEENAMTGVTPKKKKKKVWLIVLLVIALLAAVIGTAVHKMTKNVEMVSNTVEVEPVQKRDLSETISLKGTVAGERRMNVMSLAAAEITAVDVQVGDMVAEGDALVTLERADIEKQIAVLEKNIENGEMLDKFNSGDLQEALQNAKTAQTQTLEDAQKAVDRAATAYDDLRSSKIAAMIEAQRNAETEEERSVLEQATREYVNAGYLKDKDLQAAQEAIEDARNAYDRAVAASEQTVEAAQEAIDRAGYSSDNVAESNQEALEELKKQLTDCELKAPCGGVVLAVNVSVGDKNTPGQTMITIEDTSALKMVASVEEADILKLQEGMTASVISEATGEDEIQGTVTRVVRVKNQSVGTGMDIGAMAGGYSVEISLDTTNLLVGMSTKAKVMLKEKGSVLAVPYDLVRYDEDGSAYVLVAESSGDGSTTAVRRNVTVGEEVDYYTEITGGELKEGEKLIYAYDPSITEGQTFAPEQMYSNQSLNAEGMNDTDAEVVKE